jgi:hypothetical protein
MRVLIDQQPVDVHVQADQLLASVLELVRSRVAQQRRVVGRIVIDGQAIPVAELDLWLTRPCDEVGQVEVETACPRELARQTLGAVGSLLGDISKLGRGSADKLLAGQTGKAMEMLLGCLNLHKAVQEAVSQVVRLTGLNLKELRIGDQTAEQVTQELAGQLVAVKSALEAGDFVVLGDLLNYEFPKATGQWQAILAELDRALAP